MTQQYLGPVGEPMNWALIRLAYQSVADLAIVPLQDVFGLGSEGRMNTPAKPSGNWSWRFKPEALQPEYKARLRALALTYGRKEPEVKKAMPSYM